MEKWVLILLILFVVPSAFAADHYVRDGASGDGSDWTNAWDSLPPNLVRGDTYYITDGEYPSRYCNEAEEGEQYIHIKKAIESDHGTNAGWQSAYGDGVALFTGQWTIRTSYWNFDGQVGEQRSGHGFKFVPSPASCAGDSYVVYSWDTSWNPHHLNFSHVELEQCGEDTDNGDQYIFELWGVDYLTVQNCWLHDMNGPAFHVYGNPSYEQPSNLLVEDSYIAKRHTNNMALHGEFFALSGFESPANIVIRNNVMYDCMGTAFIGLINSDSSGVDIYGNLFYQTSDRYYTSNGAVGNDNAQIGSDIKVHDNTFINLYGVPLSAGTTQPPFYLVNSGGGNEFYNNVCYNTGYPLVASSGTISNSYNLYNDLIYASQDFEGGQYWDQGNELFVDIEDPDGSDGIFFTEDDGFNFQNDSLICGMGQDGEDLGCYDCTGDCGDCCVPMLLSELILVIDEWKAGEKNLNQVMQAIVEWKNGC